MMASERQAIGSSPTSSRALTSVLVAVAIAGVTHAYDFGAAAFAVAAVVAGVLIVLMRLYRRTGNRVALAGYAVVSLWVVAGFGVVGGFWNHAVKIVVARASGGALPPSLEGAFTPPEFGPVLYETAWVLLFAASMAAAYFGYRFARTVPWSRKPATLARESVP